MTWSVAQALGIREALRIIGAHRDTVTPPFRCQGPDCQTRIRLGSRDQTLGTEQTRQVYNDRLAVSSSGETLGHSVLHN